MHCFFIGPGATGSVKEIGEAAIVIEAAKESADSQRKEDSSQ